MKIDSGILRLFTKSDSIFYIKPPPTSNYIILYKKRESGFIGVQSIYLNNKIEEVKYYDIEERKEIKNFYEVIDSNCPYVYVLRKTRNYNEVKAKWKDESKENEQLVKFMKKLN